MNGLPPTTSTTIAAATVPPNPLRKDGFRDVRRLIISTSVAQNLESHTFGTGIFTYMNG